jgi:dihydroorotase
VQELKILRPDDFHVHLRQDGDLSTTVRETANVFGRALVMPNTKPPVLHWEQVVDYVLAIQDKVPEARSGAFVALMTIQITAETTPFDIRACDNAICPAGKLYPAGVTTNSENGVKDIEALYPVFAEMEKQGKVLCLHGETPGVYCHDREEHFLTTLAKLAGDFPGLRIVLEHLSTAAAVRAVESLPETVAATVTAHHLVLTLDDVIGDGLEPHHFCKPIPKRPEDRAALIEAATGGNPKFFFGSDSAPHEKGAKERSDGCAGIFSAPVALPVLAEVFEAEGRLDRLEAFVSMHGARFYGLPDQYYGMKERGTITLRKEPWTVSQTIDRRFVPFRSRETLSWKIA